MNYKSTSFCAVELILINKKIFELFNPLNGGLPHQPPHLQRRGRSFQRGRRSFHDNFKILQESQGALEFMSNRRFIDRRHPSNFSSPVSSSFDSHAENGCLSHAFLFFSLFFYQAAGVRSQSTAGSVSLNCSATFQGTCCN